MHPVLLKIGPISVFAFGAFVAIGFVAGVAWTVVEGERRGIRREQILDISLALLIGGVVGARLMFILLNPGLYSSPLEWIQTWEGGMTFHGSLIGGLAAMIFMSMIRRIPLVTLMDTSAPGLALGYGIGRIGCFLNGCCGGRECSLPWAVRFPSETGAGGVPPLVHPTQIYSVIAGLLIFSLLAWNSRQRRYTGHNALLFFVLYSTYRFIVEFFREGEPLGGTGGLTLAQVVSLAVAAGALLLMCARAFSERRRVTDPFDEPRTDPGISSPDERHVRPHEPHGKGGR